MDRERQVAGRLAARGVDEPHVGAVDEETDRDAPLAQQALEASLRAGRPVAALLGERSVEIDAGLDPLDEEQPRGGGALGIELANGERRPERLLVFRQDDFEIVDLGDHVFGLPAEDAAEEGG